MQLLVGLLLLLPGLLAAQSLSEFSAPRPLEAGDTLIIGFLGSWERWDDDHRSVRRLALAMRARGMPHVYVETAANRNRKVVLQLIRDAFDRDRSGDLDSKERAGARIILYGQSFGGAAVVKLARELDRFGVPVLLTVQIDSVGRGDGLIPPNVAAAVNFYQRDRFTIRGQSTLRAEDPSRTRILGNFRYSYRGVDIDFADEAWRELGGSHAKMERDPELWTRVERYLIDAVHSK